MCNFNSSDFVYRYNCEGEVSLNGDILKHRNELFSNVFILPFARYTYVADLLADAYSLLETDGRTIVLFTPTFSVDDDFLMCFEQDFLLNLSELINIDFDLLEKIRTVCQVNSFPFEFEYQEILRIHVDFIRAMFPQVKILPLFYNQLKKGVLSNLLFSFWDDCSFVFLSNLSSGFNYCDAKKNDDFLATCIETNRQRVFSPEEFTGFSILNELLQFCREQKFCFIRLGLFNSGDVNVNLTATKGFGAWFLYKDDYAVLINKYFKKDIKEFILFNLSKTLNSSSLACFQFPQFFNQQIKLFISFEKAGFVRGVSGSYKTPEPFYKALVKRSFGAAFSDNRFSPLRLDELDDIKIFVTIVGEEIMDSVSFEL